MNDRLDLLPDRGPAVLVLEDGRSFRGEAYGAVGETVGEAVFSTGMTGYQETLTDPSYHRQVVVMTAPHIGNTGVNAEDAESSRIWVAGYVVRDPALHRQAVDGVAAAAATLGWHVQAVVASRLPGPAGNQEFFVHLTRTPCVAPATPWASSLC